MTIDNIEFWKRGHQLEKALFAYSPKALRADYEIAHEASFLATYMESMTQAAQKGKTGAEIISTGVLAAGPIGESQRKTRAALEAFIKHHLLKGNLIGYGFEPPRKVASEPHNISPELWRGTINWSGAKLSSQGLKFEQIRLITPQIRDSVLQLTSDKLLPTRPQGRPGYKVQILKAFEALSVAGEIDPQKSLQSHYPKVRRWIELNIPQSDRSAKAASDNTLQRHLSFCFNELKKNSKL